jgi:hypothetical protein
MQRRFHLGMMILVGFARMIWDVRMNVAIARILTVVRILRKERGMGESDSLSVYSE